MEYSFKFDIKQPVIALDYGHVNGGERKPHRGTVVSKTVAGRSPDLTVV